MRRVAQNFHALPAGAALEYGVRVAAGVYNDDASVAQLTEAGEIIMDPEKMQAM